MDSSVITVLVGLAALAALILLFGQVIAWFGFRRHGWDVDYRTMGRGFVLAGAIVLAITLVTDGPWIIGPVVAGVGVAYLVRSRARPL